MLYTSFESPERGGIYSIFENRGRGPKHMADPVKCLRTNVINYQKIKELQFTWKELCSFWIWNPNNLQKVPEVCQKWYLCPSDTKYLTSSQMNSKYIT